MDTQKISPTLDFSVLTARIQKSPLKFIAIILRIIVIVFAAITALCGIIALSKVNITLVHAEIEVVNDRPELLKFAIYTNTLVCGSLFLLTCAGTILHKIIILVVSILTKDQNAMVLSIVESMLNSISAVVFISLAIGLANSANQYASLGINHPLIMSAQATAAFGFLTTFVIVGLTVFLWINFYVEKYRASVS